MFVLYLNYMYKKVEKNLINIVKLQIKYHN